MSKLSLKPKETNKSPSLHTKSAKSSTPKQSYFQDNLSIDDSPISFNSTQEGRDNLDVIWNWHSPSARPRCKLPKNPRNLLKTTNLVLPIRYDKPDLEKVKSDLELLQKEIAISQNNGGLESRLIISVNDNEYKNSGVSTKLTEDLNAFLEDDTIEEEMIIASQVAEEEVFKMPRPNQNISLPDDSFDMALENLKDEDIELLSQAFTPQVAFNKRCLKRSPEFFHKPISEPLNKKPAFGRDMFSNKNLEESVFNDTSEIAKDNRNSKYDHFDNTLASRFSKEEKERKKPVTQKTMHLLQRGSSNLFSNTSNILKSIPNASTEIKGKDLSSEVASKRLCSEFIQQQNPKVMLVNKCSSKEDQEIERNRLGALAKLETKQFIKEQEQNPNYYQKAYNIETSFSCSEFKIEREIERKKLEAQAKLNAKRTNFAEVQTQKNFTTNFSRSASCSSNNTCVIEQKVERESLKTLPMRTTNVEKKQPSDIATETSPIKCSPEEIEKKRLEALARLMKAKKKFCFMDKVVNVQHIPAANLEGEISPKTCSQEEIEQKRLNALSKLDTRKQLFTGTLKHSGTTLMRHHSTDFSNNTKSSIENSRILNNATKQKSWDEKLEERIERNRLEALRRLKENRERRRNVP